MNLATIPSNIRRRLGRYAFAVFTAGIVVGKLHPFPTLRLLIPFALLMMLFPAFLDMDRGRLSSIASSPLPFLTALSLNILLSPLLMYALTEIIRGNKITALTAGLLIFGMIPAGGMGPAYTAMLGGNVNLSLAISAVSLFLSLGTVPLWSLVLLDRIVTVPVLLITKYFFLIILLPMISALVVKGWVTRRFGEPTFLNVKGVLGDFSVLGMMMLLFIIPVVNGRLIKDSPSFILELILPAASFSLLLLVTATVAGRALRLPYRDRIALTIGATTKNTAIAMALATTAFSGREALSIAVAGPLVQLPVMLCYLNIQTRLSAGRTKIAKDDR